MLVIAATTTIAPAAADALMPMVPLMLFLRMSGVSLRPEATNHHQNHCRDDDDDDDEMIMLMMTMLRGW